MSKYKKRTKRKIIIKYKFVDSPEAQEELHRAFDILFREVMGKRAQGRQKDT